MIRVVPGFETKTWSRLTAPTLFVTTNTIRNEAAEAIWPRFPWRPYVLRSYFDTRLLMAESAGKLPSAYRTFFMGHAGDAEAQYTLNKRLLCDDLVEDMRRAFVAAEPYLATTGAASMDIREALVRSWREQAKAHGIDPRQVHLDTAADENHRPATEIP